MNDVQIPQFNSNVLAFISEKNRTYLAQPVLKPNYSMPIDYPIMSLAYEGTNKGSLLKLHLIKL